LKKTTGTSGLVIAPGETAPLPGNQSDVLAGADKSVDGILKKVVGTSGLNTSTIAPGETPLSKKVLEKPSAISKQQGKKLAENKISTPPTAGKKALEKPSGDDLKRLLLVPEISTFYMERAKSDDDSPIVVALRPRTNAWPKRGDESSNRLEQKHVPLGDLYDLFNLDALNMVLLRCFIL
jgi:hypothetical protein